MELAGAETPVGPALGRASLLLNGREYLWARMWPPWNHAVIDTRLQGALRVQPITAERRVVSPY